jgi:transcriptional regulator with XRE-family HTH domain
MSIYFQGISAVIFVSANPDGWPPPQLYLREYRVRAGLSLKELARRLEIHFTAIQKWETRVSSPTIPHLINLAYIYEVHPAALFFDPSGSDQKRRVDALVIFAGIAGVSPAALLLAGEEPERRQRAEQLTRCLAILDRLHDDWAEHWIKIGELSVSPDSD